jgi:hypothetical protein
MAARRRYLDTLLIQAILPSKFLHEARSLAWKWCGMRLAVRIIGMEYMEPWVVFIMIASSGCLNHLAEQTTMRWIWQWLRHPNKYVYQLQGNTQFQGVNSEWDMFWEYSVSRCVQNDGVHAKHIYIYTYITHVSIYQSIYLSINRSIYLSIY